MVVIGQKLMPLWEEGTLELGVWEVSLIIIATAAWVKLSLVSKESQSFFLKSRAIEVS